MDWKMSSAIKTFPGWISTLLDQQQKRNFNWVRKVKICMGPAAASETTAAFFCAKYLCLSHPTDISLAKKNFLLLVNVVDGTRMVIQSLKHGI